MVIKLPASFTGSFNYVDCGSVGDFSHPLLNNFRDSRYIGFDPELTASLKKDGWSIYFPVAVAQESIEVEFHRTQNPNCSSFFIPNQEFLDNFMHVGDFFKIIETIYVKAVALDKYLPLQGIKDIDFIELDTQGAELAILQGAQGFLSSSIVGVRVEVEFSAMYNKQPLFGEVDSYLRQFGFMLFDLERYHLRRKSCPPHVDSREQIVWGQALYLRDFRSFSGDLAIEKQKLSKLIMVASYYGFHSYALEVINYLLQHSTLLIAAEKKELELLSAQYVHGLKNNYIVRFMQKMDKSPFHKALRRWGETLVRLYEAYLFVVKKQKYFWKD